MTETVLPGETVSLIYENSPNAPRHSVDIRESQIRFDNGQFNPSVSIQEFNTLFQGFDVPSHTNHQLPAMNYDRSTKITCELDLTNHCGTTHGSAYFIVHRPSTVSLTGIEVTQAIQFFRSDEIIPNQDEWQPDNSVPLIANKPTLVRVYANSNQIRSFNNGCTFGLDIKLRGFKDGRELANSAISAINSNVLFASSDNSVNFQKGNLASSADFLLPTNWITPSVAYYHPIDQSLIQLKLVAELGIRPYEPWQRDNIDLIDDTLTATGISFNSAISLKCILVRIAYEGPNHVSTDPPTHEECVKVLNDIVHAYPTADVEILLPAEIPPHALSGVQILQADLTDAGEGGCGIGWGRLLDLLSNIKHAHEEPADAIWVALLHPSIPTSVAGGCGAGGLAAFPVDQPKVGMQEIGHAFGRSHSFEDDNYPEYGYPNFSDNPVAGDDSIGDFGVDVGGFNSSPTWNNLRIYVPTNTADFMSYLGKPKWVSPYTYTALMRNFLFDPLGDFLLRDSIAVNDRSEQIVISGSINLRTNEVDLRPLYHQRRFKKNASGTPTDYFIVLLDKFEKILVKTAVIKLYESGTNFLRILQAVPFHKGVKHIEIRQNQETLTRISRRDKLVTISHLTLSEKGNTRRLKWKIEGQENGYWCGVELTCDNGRSWTRLSEIQAITSFSCDVTHFGGGEKCRLRVFVTDGFNTTYQETNTFSLPIKSPHIIPINFNSETEFIAGYSYELQVQPIYILGVPHQTELLWFLDDKEIGKGKRVSVQFEEGKHEIRIVPEKFKEAALVVQVIAKKEDR
jgi:hypothetical protein